MPELLEPYDVRRDRSAAVLGTYLALAELMQTKSKEPVPSIDPSASPKSNIGAPHVPKKPLLSDWVYSKRALGDRLGVHPEYFGKNTLISTEKNRFVRRPFIAVWLSPPTY
ncbi:MAG TPA: hypothetical protein VG734_22790 [Lacunisphaera sp.]|nr:hypothetical protein [Lacunisphaera sp.]